MASGGKRGADRKSTRLNSSHLVISYAVFCLKKKKPHDEGDLDDAVHREEERLNARALTPHSRDNQEDAQSDDTCEERLAEPAESQATVRSFDSIVVPRHGRLGLWHDCSESPGREEDGQVLRYVIYSRSQVKHFASNLQGDFILEIHANSVVRPRSRHGIAERTELVDCLPR